ncbi:MAG: tetratricopeptide repeat protein [Phormidesmis sp.]
MSDTFQQALALIKLDQPFEALPLLNQAIEAQPEWSEAYRQRAKIMRRLGDGEGAIADYTRAIRLTPSAEIYLARALVWLSLAQVHGAITDSREAVKLKPALAGGHRLLGKALGMLGDGVGAIAAYKQAARCYLAAKDKENAQACLGAIGPLRALPPLMEERGSRGAGEQRSGVTPEVFMARVRASYAAGEYAQAMKALNWFLDF